MYLVAALGAGVGEAGRDLVSPAAVHAPASGLFGERLKAGRNIAHIRCAAEHDGVGAVEDVPVRIAEFLDGDDGDMCTRISGARGNGIGQYRRVAESRVVGDDEPVRRRVNRCTTCYFDSIS